MTQALDALSDPKHADRLAASAAGFLAQYGTPALMDGEWAKAFDGVRPEDRFARLLACCGYENDPSGFFIALGRALAGGPGPDGICVNKKALDGLFLYHLLKAAAPGEVLFSIRTLEQLTRRTGLNPEPGLQQVLDTYPVRLSSHVIRQSMVSRGVAVQYLPFEDELDPTGHDLTFDGHFKHGLMEQMYRNRAIFLLDMRCPVYCRFCFRKHKSLRREAPPEQADVTTAVERVRQNREIKEILITGGEPLLNPGNLEAALEGLMDVDHVRFIRIATRSLAYAPHLFSQHDSRLIRYLKFVQAGYRMRGKRLEIGVHMVHPDEVSVETLEIISEFTASGIPVYVQTPFLKGVNHRGADLKTLFDRLRLAGAQIYYIFTPCHPIHGTRKYWSPIALSLDAYAWMRKSLSDRAMPKLCTATPLGKMEWHTSGWAVEKDQTDPGHIWIRTPYTREYFSPLIRELPVVTRENSGGTLDVKCLIDMGREGLFLKDDGPAGMVQKAPPCRRLPDKAGLIERIQSGFYAPAPLMRTALDTGVPGLVRVHKTRVLMDLDSGSTMDKGMLDYLTAQEEVRDLVFRIPDSGDPEAEACAVENTVDALKSLNRPWLFIRLQWPAMQTAPDAFGPDLISRLRALCRFDISAPVRLECETWWLVPEQIGPAHERLFPELLDAGIPVYANTALISGLNTDPDTAQALAHRIRAAGMEFHHVYTGGLEVQKRFGSDDPVTMDEVIALASRIRMNCTGREVPLYVAWTPAGEKDFREIGAL